MPDCEWNETRGPIGVPDGDEADPFENLQVWKRSARLSADCYVGLRKLTDWGCRDQITRAGLSPPPSIAEDYEHGSEKDLIKFLHYTRGSAGEIRTRLCIGIEIGYTDKPNGHRWITEAGAISKMLSALIKAQRTFTPLHL